MGTSASDSLQQVRTPAADSQKPVNLKRQREELQLLKEMNLAKYESLAIQREQNEMELKHKDEIQQRLRIERQEYLEFTRKKQDLNQKKSRWENHRRSTVDPNETESDSD
jgi:hypothetical protein